MEWTPDEEAIIRARSGTEFFLASFNDAQRRNCSQSGVLVDQPLKPPRDTNVNDIDRKYFVLHKFIGDIVWMSGVYDDDEFEDEEGAEMYVTEDNIDLIMAKLCAPEMHLVPREREAMFGTRIGLVHKDKVGEINLCGLLVFTFFGVLEIDGWKSISLASKPSPHKKK